MQTISLGRRVRVDIPTAALWTFLFDTDRLNRALGLDAVAYTSDPRHPGHRIGASRYAGVPVRYEELPFEWIEPRFYQVTRRFPSGPIQEVTGGIRLQPAGEACYLEVFADVTPRNVVGRLAVDLVLRRSLVDRIIDRVRSLEASRRDARAFSMIPPALVNERQLDARTAALREAVRDDDLCRRLRQRLVEASDLEVTRMRPFDLADEWGRSRTEVLRFLLHAARAGLVDLVWTLVCPHCLAATERADHLAALAPAGRCDLCGIDIGTDLSASVEAVFTANAGVRQARPSTFCIGGPANTPQVLAQIRIDPKTTRTVTAELPIGRLRLRTLTAGETRLLSVEPHAGQGTASVRATDGHFDVAPDAVSAGPCEIRLDNRRAVEVLLIVEKEGWRDRAATAAMVMSLQDFRDLFPGETVAPGREIAMSRVAMLFTDLQGSTQLYEAAGDVKAFDFVHSHFRYLTQAVAERRGGVVKTIGDAIMASFSSARDAVEAGLAMQAGWQAFVAAYPLAGHVKLRVGVHQGSAVAINSAGQLDYFGTAVNIAARAEAQSSGGDVVVTDAVRGDPEVASWLGAGGATVEPFTAALKGIRTEHQLYRLTPLKDAAKSTASASADTRLDRR